MRLMQAFRRWLLRTTRGFAEWVGKVHAPYAHKRITGVHYEVMRRELEPGDVLMSRTEGELTNLFIPGFWSHGAVYLGDGRVVEAIGEGVVETDLISWMLSKDYVRAMRATFADRAARRRAAEWCERQVGKPYDYDFSAGNEAFYCFELTYGAYQAACGLASPWKLRTTLGVETVVGDDFDRAFDKWRAVFDSRRWVVTRALGMPVLAEAR